MKSQYKTENSKVRLYFSRFLFLYYCIVFLTLGFQIKIRTTANVNK